MLKKILLAATLALSFAASFGVAKASEDPTDPRCLADPPSCDD
jgi:hypothetical protein